MIGVKVYPFRTTTIHTLNPTNHTQINYKTCKLYYF